MKGPTEKPLGLDMDFGDALARFIRTDPVELSEKVSTAKAATKRAGNEAPSQADEEAPYPPNSPSQEP